MTQGWLDPRPNDFSEEGLRARFKSLQDFLTNPTFINGIALGNGSQGTYDDTTGVTAPPATSDVDADTMAGIDTDLAALTADLATAASDITALEGRFPITEVDIDDDAITTPKLFADSVTAAKLAAINLAVGKWIASTSYSAGVSGWIIEADGSAEFNDVTVRGSVTATEFHGADIANVCSNPGFDTNTTGWTAAASSTISRVTNAVANGTDPGYRTSPACLKVLRSAGSGSQGAYYSMSCAPGDVIYASGWISAETVVFGDEVGITMRFYDGGVLQRTESMSEANFSGAYQFVEKYFHIPTGSDWAGVDSVQIEFWESGGSTTDWMGLDDVTIGLAPLLEVPYVVTNEDASSVRGIVSPDHIGFQQGMGYPEGMLKRANRVEMTGPLAASGFQSRVDLETSSDGLQSRVQVIAEELVLGTGATDCMSWTTWAPTTTGQTEGNGTTTAAYCVVGKICFIRYHFRLGSTSAMPGSGSIVQYTLPFTPAGSGFIPGAYSDSSAFGIAFIGGMNYSAGNTVATLMSNGAYVGPTSPFTWAVNDEVRICGSYEIA